MSASLKEIKAKGLARRRQQERQGEGGNKVDFPGSVFFRQLKEANLKPNVIRQARHTGVLNLSNCNYAEVPDIVWNVTNLTAEETKSLNVSMSHGTQGEEEEGKWWDFVELAKLDLSSNSIRCVSPAISNYQKLMTLNLHINSLSDLPSELGELQNLVKLDISRNHFQKIPDCVYCLQSLKHLNMAHNELSELNDDFGNLSFLDQLDLSHNRLAVLPPCIGFLSRLSDFNCSNNQLTSLPAEVGDLTALRQLDLSVNKLEALPDTFVNLRQLEQVFLQDNKLLDLPQHPKSLKVLNASFNSIKCLTPEFIESVPTVLNLMLRDNRISQLPDEVCSLQSLEMLVLSNNNLSSLPYTLGFLQNLKTLNIDGNPLRSIRRDIIERGTQQLLKWLVSRIDDQETLKRFSRLSCGDTNGNADAIDPYSLRSSKTLSLCNKNMTTIRKDHIDIAVGAGVTALDVSKNKISELPQHLENLIPQLTEMVFAFNKLFDLSPIIGLGTRLQYLDLRNNNLENLPSNISDCTQLRELNISCNKFKEIPECVYTLSRLEILLASGNSVSAVDVEGLGRLARLATLDLRNNAIRQLPAQVGNLTQLRSLQLEGNCFRYPCPEILSRGTPYLLEFMRRRIAQ